MYLTSYRKSPQRGKLASLPIPDCNQTEYINKSKKGIFKKKNKKFQNTEIIYPLFLPGGNKSRIKKQNKNIEKIPNYLKLKKNLSPKL